MTSRPHTRGTLEWDIQTVIGSHVDEDGFLELQLDDLGDEGGPPVPVQYIHGLWACPLDAEVDPDSGQPIPAKASAAFSIYEGGERHCVPLSDPRTIGQLPLGKPGEAILHNDYGCYVRLHENGAISAATTTDGGAPSGQAVTQWVQPTYFARSAPWGQERFDQHAYRIRHVGGARLTLGYAGGLVPGQGSTFRAQADMVEINGSSVSIGPSGVPAGPVVAAQQFQTVLTAVGVALTAVQTSLADPTLLGSPSAAPVAAAVALIATFLETCSTRTAVG